MENSLTTLFAGGSLLIAFLGGMVMLFAPCCITLMLPAYLGTIFKSRFKVVLLTLVFAAGVLTVMLPIVLGARIIVSFLNSHHLYVFVAGSLLMVGVGLMALFNKTIKMPFVSRLQSPQATNVTSAYVLGVVSGASSACCAPVVLGALTLSALSPTLWQAAAVGVAYTLGIVFPLFLLALFVRRGVPKQFLRLQKRFLQLGKLRVSLANFLAFLIFTITGIVMFVLAITNSLSMNLGTAELSVKLKGWVDAVAEPVQQIPFYNLIFAALLIGFFVYIFHLLRQEKEVTEEKKHKNV